MIEHPLNTFFNRIKGVIKNNILLDKYEKDYVNFNRKFWKKKSIKSKKIILIDLFHWYPLIHFWSYLANILSNKENAEIKYFYFYTLKNKISNSKFFINKLDKIYKSFNVEKGITSYDFNFNQTEVSEFSKKFDLLKKSKFKINKYKIDNVKIGDLIYDSYLFQTRNSSLDFEDPRLKEIFIEANKIYYSCKKYFKKNKVEFLIPSHVCYIPYGIITRIALKNNSKVYKVKCENWANAFFRLLKVDKNAKLDEQPYYHYKRVFNKFKISDKKKFLIIGKKILNKRLSGGYDQNLPYMKINQFRKSKNKLSNKYFSKKPKIIIFSHCFYDNPHRFRKLYFNDFYEQIKYILDLSLKLNKYEWYYKPHPNELFGNFNIHNFFKKNYSHVNFLDKNTSHRNIIALKPELVITNHGTIAHEYASFKIPVVNTGDNPHINYKFCLHAKSKTELNKILHKVSFYKKKINYDKNEIYEFLYMHYEHFPNLFNRKNLIKDNFFVKKHIEENRKSSILKYYLRRHNSDNKYLNLYIENFIRNN